MIFDELATTTKDMQDLQRKISIQKNQDEQNATDKKFRMLLVQLGKTIDVIEYLHCNMNVNFDGEILANTVSTLAILEESIENGVAEKEKVYSAEKGYRTLQTELKKTWSKQFNQLTIFTLGTLNVIQKINPEKVLACINRIQAAKIWDNNLNQVQNMKMAIDEAGKLIGSLGLDEEIKTFLSKIRNGEATLEDIFSSDDKILNWIKKENLQGKMYVSLK